MAGGAKLASGYIELTVKTGTAMKELVASITGLDKDAAKAGKAAGDALNKGLSQGAKQAGKSIGDELTKAAGQAGSAAGEAITQGVTKAAEKAGSDAGEAISKGVTKGAKGAGKTVSDELTKAAKQAGKDVENVKVEPKVTPKVDTKPAEQQVKGLGDQLESVMGAAGTEVGKRIGTALKDSPVGHFAQDLAKDVKGAAGSIGVDLSGALTKALDSDFKGAGDQLAQNLGKSLGRAAGSFAKDKITDLTGINPEEVANSVRSIRDAYADPSTLGGGSGGGGAVSDTLRGASSLFGAAGDLGDAFGKKRIAGLGQHAATLDNAANLFDHVNTDQPANKGIGDILADIGVSAGGGAGIGAAIPFLGETGIPEAIGAILGGGGAIASNWDSIMGHMPWHHAAAPAAPTASSTWLDSVSGGPSTAEPYGGTTSASEVAVSTQLATVSAGSVTLGGNIALPSSLTAGLSPRASAPSVSIGSGSEGNSTASLYGGGSNSLLLGKYSGGGVVGRDKDGKLIGPGTGTSDSILGVDENGVPTAKVSNGEGVVKDDAMKNGGAPIVSALNAGASPDQLAAAAPAGIGDRTQGYIPAGAGAAGQSGSSLFSGALGLGAQAINGWIDQAGSAAATAIGAAATAGSFGAGGEAAGPAASFAIGLGTKAAERGVSYGFQMAGIGADALTEIFSPFGVPRYFQTDPTQFMPHLGVQPTAVTTGEKAQTQGEQQAAGETPNPALNPGGPVQAGQLPGAQPIAPPVQAAKPSGVAAAPVPIGAPPGGAAPTPTEATPAAPKPVSPIAPPTPQSGPDAGQPPPQRDPLIPSIGSMVFDDGGWLPAGGIGINKSNRPEPVLNSDQWGAVQNVLAQQAAPPDPSGNGGHDYSVQFHGDVTTADADALADKIASKQRLAAMRYAGRP